MYIAYKNMTLIRARPCERESLGDYSYSLRTLFYALTKSKSTLSNKPVNFQAYMVKYKRYAAAKHQNEHMYY